MICYDKDIIGFYRLCFQIVKNSNMTLTELENMVPYEYEIYTNLLIEDIQKWNEKRQRK